jgi:hypothetical protein
MTQYITRTASGQTLTTSPITLTSNFGDSNLSLIVPAGSSFVKKLVLSIACPVGTGDFAVGVRLDGNSVTDGSQDFSMGAIIGTTSGQTGAVIVEQDVDVAVKAGNTLNLKLMSTVSAANCDIVLQAVFA